MPIDPSQLTFGVEIECYLPEGQMMAHLAAAVQNRVGRNCIAANYNHHTVPHWKIVTDGSLGSYDRGCELVSPVLTGAAGIEETEKAVKALADFGCTVNKKCGLHVHVGVGVVGAPTSLDILKKLVNFYAGFEPVIDSLMPRSRRASNNGYCRTMTTASPAAVSAATDIASLSNAIGNGRYCKVNVNSYTKYRTAEFRQHAGTLDSTKVKFWIKTCLRMVAAVRNGAEIRVGTGQPQSIAPAAPAALVNRAREGSASWIIGNMMMRPEGCTGPEARAAVNWPSVSMPQQARACGLTYTTTRVGREVRYFARVAQAEIAAQAEAATVTPILPPTPITLLGFIQTIEASTDEASYLLQRQADLGGPIEWAA